MSEITRNKILAVDFDDTIAISRFNEETKETDIVGYNENVVSFIKKFKANGGRVILNTCRHDHSLEVAVEYCRSLGLEFDKVNENLDEEVEMFGDCGTSPRSGWIEKRKECAEFLREIMNAQYID